MAKKNAQQKQEIAVNAIRANNPEVWAGFLAMRNAVRAMPYEQQAAVAATLGRIVVVAIDPEIREKAAARLNERIAKLAAKHVALDADHTEAMAAFDAEAPPTDRRAIAVAKVKERILKVEQEREKFQAELAALE